MPPIVTTKPEVRAAATRTEAASQEKSRTKIEVRKLDFFYGKYHALKNINLQIPERKITAFIGPSGCGKSTLLRTFNRMYALYPSQEAKGEILVDGENVLSVASSIATWSAPT